MTIDELQQLPINKSIAYIVGLSLPLYKTIEICGVNYQGVVDKVNNEDLEDIIILG